MLIPLLPRKSFLAVANRGVLRWAFSGKIDEAPPRTPHPTNLTVSNQTVE